MRVWIGLIISDDVKDDDNEAICNFSNEQLCVPSQFPITSILRIYLYLLCIHLLTLFSVFIQLEATKSVFKITAKCNYGKTRRIFGKGAYFEGMPDMAMNGMMWQFRIYPNGKDGAAIEKSHVGVILLNSYAVINENNKDDEIQILVHVRHATVCFFSFFFLFFFFWPLP